MTQRLLASLALIAGATAVAQAQPYQIDWYTIDGGGAQAMTGGPYELSGTAGQADAATTIGGGSYRINAGFWPGVYQDCLADWNIDGIVNTSDFLAYLNDYIAVQSGGPFNFRDPDLAFPFGTVNTSDFLAFLNLFNGGCP